MLAMRSPLRFQSYLIDITACRLAVTEHRDGPTAAEGKGVLEAGQHRDCPDVDADRRPAVGEATVALKRSSMRVGLTQLATPRHAPDLIDPVAANRVDLFVKMDSRIRVAHREFDRTSDSRCLTAGAQLDGRMFRR